MNRESHYDRFIDLFLDSVDDDEPYGVLSSESLVPGDVETAWSSSPPPSVGMPEDW